MNYEVIPSLYQPVSLGVVSTPSVAERLHAQQPVCQSVQYPVVQPQMIQSQYPQMIQAQPMTQYPVQYPQYPVVQPVCQQPVYPIQYPQPIQDRQIVMTGTNPIRGGMYTSMYTDTCSQYGSSSVRASPQEFYGGSRWCQVGIVTSQNRMNGLEARYRGNMWEMRVKDPITGLVVYLDQIGNGPYGAFRTNDQIVIPGKDGIWTVQVQVQENPYILYVP
jgi:hypothetical protein